MIGMREQFRRTAGKRQRQLKPKNKFLATAHKLSDSFDLIKSFTLAIGSVVLVLLFVFVIGTAIFNTDTLVEPISVPPSFIEKGYTSEITTTRLLDEIAKVHSVSTTPMPKKDRLGNKQPGDDLMKLQSLPLAGRLDFNALQAVIQEAFGVKKERLTGEITYVQTNGKYAYQVRIRSKLANRLLVDFNVEKEIPDVLKDTAVKMVEQLEPVVAASYHAWTRDEQSRLRLIDEALRNEDPTDDAYALMDRFYFYSTRGNRVLAQEDISSVLARDPNFGPALCGQSLLYRQDKKYEESLAFATRCLDRWPNNWRSTLNMAYTYRALDRKPEAEAMYMQAVKLGITIPRELDRIAQYFRQQGQDNEALVVYADALRRSPDTVMLLVHYADILIKQRRFDQANQSLLKAYSVQPDEPEVWFELLRDEVSKDEGLKQALKLKLTQYAQDHPDKEISRKFNAMFAPTTEKNGGG